MVTLVFSSFVLGDAVRAGDWYALLVLYVAAGVIVLAGLGIDHAVTRSVMRRGGW